MRRVMILLQSEVVEGAEVSLGDHGAGSKTMCRGAQEEKYRKDVRFHGRRKDADLLVMGVRWVYSYEGGG